MSKASTQLDSPWKEILELYFEDFIWDELEKSNSPFSIVVRTHLKGLETRKSPEKRLYWKVRLFKSLHKAKYTRKEIQELFRFIDWMLALPDALEQEFRDAAAKYEEKKKVPYVTSIERIGIKKGITKGILQKSREDVIEILRVRFKKIPKSLVKAIRSISDVALLSKLHRKAILAKSIKSVERRIEKESENSERKLNTVKTARYTHSVTPTFDSLTG